MMLGRTTADGGRGGRDNLAAKKKRQLTVGTKVLESLIFGVWKHPYLL